MNDDMNDDDNHVSVAGEAECGGDRFGDVAHASTSMPINQPREGCARVCL